MVIVFLADGFEETEAVTAIDILRRAELSVITAGIGKRGVIGSHGIAVTCDQDSNGMLPDGTLSAVILPGGMPGTLNLEKNAEVREFIRFAMENGVPVGAICAAPSILGHMGVMDGVPATCFPGFEDSLPNFKGGAVVNHENRIITSAGAGTAVPFALEMVKVLCGEPLMKSIKDGILWGLN